MSDSLQQKLSDTGRECGLIALYLHGSYVSGTARPDSDVDLAALPPHEWSASRCERVMDRLSAQAAEVLGCTIDRIDMQNLRDAPAAFRARVVTVGRLLWVVDPTELARFQARSMMEAWDEEYFLRPIREAMRKRIQESRFAS